MSLATNTLIAFSMSADAFAAATCKGTQLKHPKLSEALRIGAIFGVIEGITPIVGWALGIAFAGTIASIDHWVAFGILSLLGIKMIHEAFGPEHCEAEPRSPKLKVLILTAFGTSIDAMAIGVTVALLERNILVIAGMIGAATFLMATVGVMTGHYLGLKAGKRAELLGGITLILIGTFILLEHLGVL